MATPSWSCPSPQIAEPDDGAYHHPIVAITMGNFLTLSSAQLNAPEAKMGGPVGQLPNQWVELANGRGHHRRPDA
jgi:hypothetical protein